MWADKGGDRPKSLSHQGLPGTFMHHFTSGYSLLPIWHVQAWFVGWLGQTMPQIVLGGHARVRLHARVPEYYGAQNIMVTGILW